ncbi:MAG: hypothetical protein ACREH4_07945 [Vitreimonas sp.]
MWPHDNSLIAAGAARYQAKSTSTRILSGLFEAATFFDLYRLPELFCGFRQRGGEGPTRYPVACSPQAWASGSVFLMLEAVLGLQIDAPRRLITLSHPALPAAVDEVFLRDLQIGDSWLDLRVHRYQGSVGVTVERRTGKVDVVVHS